MWLNNSLPEDDSDVLVCFDDIVQADNVGMLKGLYAVTIIISVRVTSMDGKERDERKG